MVNEAPGASTRYSHLRVKTEKPAGISPPANHWRSRMIAHLLFLLLIVVILGLKVKIIIERP
jgi:hypothetical protein